MVNVIEGLKPWKVMKGSEEDDKRIAWLNETTDKWVEWTPPVTLRSIGDAIANGYKIAIIGDIKSEINIDSLLATIIEEHERPFTETANALAEKLGGEPLIDTTWNTGSVSIYLIALLVKHLEDQSDG